jgi:Mn2+/Fe2+ NRAMP family transporter
LLALLGLIIKGVQALAGVLLPAATVFLLLLCNDRAVLGTWGQPPPDITGRQILGIACGCMAVLAVAMVLVIVRLNFTVQGTGDHGQPLYQAYQINVNQDLPLTVVLPASGSTLYPGTAGQALALNFFLSGGAGPYTWAVAAGQLPPGLTLKTFGNPRDADNELAGTPTTAGTFTFTMRLTDYAGQQATQQFTLTIQP